MLHLRTKLIVEIQNKLNQQERCLTSTLKQSRATEEDMYKKISMLEQALEEMSNRLFTLKGQREHVSSLEKALEQQDELKRRVEEIETMQTQHMERCGYDIARMQREIDTIQDEQAGNMETCQDEMDGLWDEVSKVKEEVRRKEENGGLSLQSMKNELHVLPPDKFGSRDTDDNNIQKMVDNFFTNTPLYKGENSQDYDIVDLFQDLKQMQTKLHLSQASFVDQVVRRLDTGVRREMRAWDVENPRTLPLIELYYKLQESSDGELSSDMAEKKLLSLEDWLKPGDGLKEVSALIKKYAQKAKVTIPAGTFRQAEINRLSTSP